MSRQFDTFATLHHPGNPLLLYNIWDVGSARAVVAAGAPAISTGSHGLAEAMGFADGETIPLNLFLDSVRRIVEAVDVPVSADFEGGFAADPSHLAEHARLLAETGAVGCNFEDQIIGGEGLHPVHEQARRVAAVAESGMWVSARTDMFLKLRKAGKDVNDRASLGEVLERAHAYAGAGAHSFFVPGVTDPAFIAEICDSSPLPVHVILLEGMDLAEVSRAGVSRVSWGPYPWLWTMNWLTEQARPLYTKL